MAGLRGVTRRRARHHRHLETEACQAEISKMKSSGLPFGDFLRDDGMLRFVCGAGVKFVTTSASGPANSLRR
jgi:hypothetical protein